MELHSAAALKKLRSYVKVALFMARKGIISKRSKLVMDMNLMLKRGKLASKSLRGLIHHQHRRRHRYWASPVTLHGGEYEFSCSSSPNPVFFHVKRRRNYFPCLNTVTEEPMESSLHLAMVLPKMIERSRGSPELELTQGGEDQDIVGGWEVDEAAEEFIRRFYEQLRTQRRTALLEYYQEDEQQNYMEEFTTESHE